jgi:F0F1-type ATP synthase membrane subunit c/vacuolar-type H+-ATPase subunit K
MTNEIHHLAAGIAFAVVGLWATLALLNIGKAWLEGLSRNPEADKKMFVPGIIAMAFAEWVALFALGAVYLILNAK